MKSLALRILVSIIGVIFIAKYIRPELSKLESPFGVIILIILYLGLLTFLIGTNTLRSWWE